MTPPTIVVVMGVSGSGKSTVAHAVAAAFNWEVGEGDDLHSRANVEKMAAGVPLTDDDRQPWLRAVRDWIDERADSRSSAVIACSALRRSYRDVLRHPDVLFVLLDGSRDELWARVQGRHGHFMPATLLDSQLATLERPDPDERALIVPISWELQAQVAAIGTAADARSVGSGE